MRASMADEEFNIESAPASRLEADPSLRQSFRGLVREMTAQFEAVLAENLTLRQELDQLFGAGVLMTREFTCGTPAGESTAEMIELGPTLQREVTNLRDEIAHLQEENTVPCKPNMYSETSPLSENNCVVLPQPAGGRGFTSMRSEVAEPWEATDPKEHVDAKTLQSQFERLCNETGCFALSAERCYELMCEHLNCEVPEYARVVEAVNQLVTSVHAFAKDEGEDQLDYNAFFKLMTMSSRRRSTSSASAKSVLESLRQTFHLEAQHHFLNEMEERQKERLIGSEEPESNGLAAVLLDSLPAMVIIANAIVLGIQEEVEPESIVWSIVEVVFVTCYIIEAVAKICLLGFHCYVCGRDRYWNWFDSLCIVCSIVDLIQAQLNLVLLKSVRLVRLVRLIKALHYPFFDDLKLIVMGIFSGMKVLFWSLQLLIFFVFLVAYILKKLVSHEYPELATFSQAMFTVFRCFTDGCSSYNGLPFQAELYRGEGGVFMVLYILVFMFVTFGLFNLIMASFIENVMLDGAAQKQVEIGASAKTTRAFITSTFQGLIGGGTNKSNDPAYSSLLLAIIGKLSRKALNLPAIQKLSRQSQQLSEPAIAGSNVGVTRDVFHVWLHDPQVINMLEGAEIDTSAKFELFDVLDVDDGGELSLDELIDGLMRLRGPITKSDVVAVRLKQNYTTRLVRELVERIDSLESCLNPDRMSLADMTLAAA
eukprot:TRINITY_DN27407_c0_g1_i1.p1 TRINITY_DN27407_c0_g1~~TRINITY_DN27407_c0_g1_i1.p1  ORF type:complete len:709 (+),score=124.50 TRINITY_DN27407_c0_g1_i1:35-2161(+)